MKEFFSPKTGLCYLANDFVAGRPTLIFLHGLAGSLSAWVAYDALLGQKYNIILVDLRGHGKSKKPSRYEDYEVHKFVDDIIELIRELHLEQFNLVGHSLGTLLAAAVFQLQPHETRSVTFLCPIFRISEFPFAQFAARLTRLAAAALAIMPFNAGKRRHVDYTRFPNSGDWNLRRILADTRNTGLHAYLYSLSQLYAADCDEWWYNINKPCLIIHGKRDSLIPVKNAGLLAGEISRCKLVVLEDANHILVLNNVAEVGRAIERFIDNEADAHG
jgi:pimeloyl-ACP methyl ester carboxylesterase